jgi:hypothetical protein
MEIPAAHQHVQPPAGDIGGADGVAFLKTVFGFLFLVFCSAGPAESRLVSCFIFQFF